MKRIIIALIAYATTGIGVYHTFFKGFDLYGMTILLLGLIGVLYDIFHRKLYRRSLNYKKLDNH
jgi:hypothetical protein